jgi:hypothetical protein
MWKRLIAAGKLLSRMRPAELQFDELDDRIAEGCAFATADIIAGRLIPPPIDLATDDENCRQIARLIKEAIKQYSSNHLTDICRDELRQEKAYRQTCQNEEEIPF